MNPTQRTSLAAALAALLLAIHPALWLVRTWQHPAFDSSGAWVFAALAALWAICLRSGPPKEPGDRAIALRLLFATALVRALGEVLAIDVLGGVALAVDVYALGLLLHLRARPWALSPFWSAIAFLLTLPVERILQRVFGYPLQWISANGAAALLRAVSSDVVHEGTRIQLNGHDVLVDLPCAGTQSAFILCAAFALYSTRCRPRVGHAMLGVGLVLAGATVGNGLRIATIAGGIAYGGAWSASFATGAAHQAVGLLTLVLSLWPISRWAANAPLAAVVTAESAPLVALRLPRWAAVVLVPLAALVLVLPARPVDMSASFPALSLPAQLGHITGEPLPLTVAERAAYEAHGGTAVRRGYGPHTVLAVRTTSPLRHLHDPEECLRGLGLRVERLGIVWLPEPAAVYRVEDTNGAVWRVHARFIADDGTAATSVAQVVFAWLQDPSVVWTGVQRISPWNTPAEAGAHIDRQLTAALGDASFSPALSPYTERPQ